MFGTLKKGDSMEHMTYREAIEYIHGLYWKGKKNGLEKTKELLALCGHPERGLKIIHIAGTNGKGSTAVMLASVLECAGYRTGLYTSPYIVRYNERVQVNRTDIPDEDLARLTKKLSVCVEQMEVPPSEFEFGTVLAFLYFKEMQCDVVVLETGLGGSFDSTNVITDPCVCVITALGYDHTSILGNTMEQIAEAKAGIIKQGCDVVFYGEEPDGERVIRNRCEELSVSLTIPDFSEISDANSAGLTEEQIRKGILPKQRFSYKRWKNLEVSLPGEYQKKNAAVVLETLELLGKKEFRIPEEAVYRGLSEVFWQARLEVLSTCPLLLVDGSHNPQGMKATTDSLKAMFPERKLIFVFGAMADKDLTQMVSLFLPMAKKVYVTAPLMPRAMKAEKLTAFCEEQAKELGLSCEMVCCPEVSDALLAVRKEKKEEIAVIIGSLYLAGETKNLLSEM